MLQSQNDSKNITSYNIKTRRHSPFILSVLYRNHAGHDKSSVTIVTVNRLRYSLQKRALGLWGRAADSVITFSREKIEFVGKSLVGSSTF